MRAKPILYCVYMLVALMTSVHSQDSKSNFLSMSFGGSNFHVLDRHAGYLIFRGTGIAPSLNYRRLCGKSEHSVAGSFYYDNLRSSSDNYKTEIIGGQFRYAYFRTIRSEKAFISAGLSLSSHYFQSEYQFKNRKEWARAIISWYWKHSIDVALRLKKQWNKSKLELDVYIPVVCNISRPEFSSSGNYDYERNSWVVETFGTTEFIAQSPGINSILTYTLNLSERLNLNAGYEFSYSQYSKSELIRFYMNNIRIGLSYGFKSHRSEL